MNTMDKAQRRRSAKCAKVHRGETEHHGETEPCPTPATVWGRGEWGAPVLRFFQASAIQLRTSHFALGRKGGGWGLGLISLAGVALASTALGEAGPAAFGEMTGRTTPDLVPMLGRTLLSLVVIGVLIYLVLFLLRKSLYKRWRGGDGGDLVSVLGSTFMGPKKAVYLLKVMDRILIVGVTDAHISLLSEITEASAVESAIRASRYGGGASPSRFFEHLDAFVTRLKKGERNAQGKIG